MHLLELTERDFRASPVWRCIYEGAYTVNPRVFPEEREDLGEAGPVCLVATTFLDRSRIEYPGFCSPQDPSSMEYLQPVMFLHGKQFPFWPERPLTGVEREHLLASVGKSAKWFFPLTLRLAVSVAGKRPVIRLSGFDELHTDFFLG